MRIKRQLLTFLSSLSTLFLGGCLVGPLTPGEEAAELSKYCSSVASQLPKANEITMSDETLVSFGECMSDHGYIDQIHRDH